MDSEIARHGKRSAKISTPTPIRAPKMGVGNYPSRIGRASRSRTRRGKSTRRPEPVAIRSAISWLPPPTFMASFGGGARYALRRRRIAEPKWSAPNEWSTR